MLHQVSDIPLQPSMKFLTFTI